MINNILKYGLQEKTLKIKDVEYKVFFKEKQSSTQGDDVPKLVIPSKLPDKNTVVLLDLCLKTIKKFTKIPYELWVVDNCSPMENIKWLLDMDGINLVLNRTKSKEDGSFENALGLEIATKLVDPNTKYLMTLHQDTVVCQDGWLETMLSKFSTKIKAVGVREDKARVKEGILHVLGYIIDFQLFRKLNLSFFPELPGFDVGDKVIVELKKHGYEAYAFENTIWDTSVVNKMPKDSPYRDITVDRTIDESGNVFFMHLGRGTFKSTGQYYDANKTIELWREFINSYLLGEILPAKNEDPLEKLKKELWYSPRRYFVDEFFLNNIGIFKPGDKILDMGGKKKNKRGVFDIEKYDLSVSYANLDPQTEPDYLCDITHVPVESNTFDGVILAEVLEHVPNPNEIITEAYRVLKPRGKLLITTPFVYNTHADPYDYGRYTDYWYQSNLATVGFKNIKIEKQGQLFVVIANILKTFVYSVSTEWPRNKILRRLLHKFVFWFTKKSLGWDQKEYFQSSNIFTGYTTGYGVVCQK